MKDHYLGIDIGGTKIKMILLDADGNALEKKEVLTEDFPSGQERWKEKIIDLIEEKSELYKLSESSKLKIAISSPGLVNDHNTMIIHMPERLQGIAHFNWSVELQRNISVINDGHAACLAEYETFYRPEGIQHLVLLTLGTGVGGGIIMNGQLYQGNLQRAGHVGHMTIDYNGKQTMTNMPGSLEYTLGNFSVSERTKGHYNSVRDLVDAYKNGDAKAETWWLESVQKLAVGLASLTNILAPELIVLGGGITAGAGDLLTVPLSKFMDKYEWRPGNYRTKIKIAKLGAYAGAMGAAYFAKHRTIKKDA